ncbi:hypothetical protein DYH09_24480 [bacterium CPR1]|nr:hypothetical protein [bacterium CPR1]
MNTLTPVALSTNSYVSSAAGKKPADDASGGETKTPVAAGDEVSISAGSEEKPSKKGLGRIGKAVAVLALGAALLGTTGCAVTTGGYNAWGGYQTQTTGIGVDGSIYSHGTRTTPWGTQSETTVIGPGGVYYENQHHNHPVYVPRAPVCTPMTWWGPGTCY